VLVFLALFFWQMPEFYSIAIYRRDEYAAASVPVITVVKNKSITVRYIFAYTVLFSLSVLALSVYSYTSLLFGLILFFACAYWLSIGYQGFTASDIDKWAKKMFHFSLVILL